jgi:hypothetical protein
MGNLFSNSQDEDNINENTHSYNLTDINSLKETLGKIEYNKLNYDLLNENFYFKDLENIKKNINIISDNNDINIEELFMKILKSIESNLILNYLKEDWLNNPIDKEGDNFTLIDNSIVNIDINDDIKNIINGILNKNDEINIRRVYRCNFVFEIKDNIIYNRPLYKNVDYKNVYLGYDGEQFVKYGKYDNVDKNNKLVLDILVFELDEDKVVIYYEDVNFLNDELKETYDSGLFNYLELAITSMDNNNNREMSSYINKFKKILKIEMTDNIYCKMGDIEEGKTILLKDFLENLEL